MVRSIQFSFLYVSSFLWAQGNEPYTLAGLYEKLHQINIESYAISSELKDSLRIYGTLFKETIPYKRNLSDLERFKYYKAQLIAIENNERATEAIELLGKRFEKEDIPMLYRINFLRELAMRYDHMNDSEKALELFFKAFELSLKEGNPNLASRCAHHISYLISNRFPRTEQWFHREKELITGLNESYDLGALFTKQSDHLLSFPRRTVLYDLKEESHFFKGYKDAICVVRDGIRNMELEVKGEKDLNQRKLIAAKHFEELISYFENRHKTNNLYYNVIHAYVLSLSDFKEYGLAALYADKLNQILPGDIGYDYFDYVSFYENAAHAHKAMGNFERSLYYSEKKNEYNFIMAYNIEKSYDYLLDRINGVNQANIALEWVNDKKRSSIIIIAISAVSILGLIILYLSFINARRLRKSRNDALLMIREKELLENKVEMLESVISRDLHDNFGNKITGILQSYEIMKEINKKENLKSKLFSKFNANLENGLSELLTDIKDLVWVNDPKNNSLDRLLFRLANHFEQTSCKVTVLSSFERDITLPKFWNRQLFLIFKEALENACRHSGAEKIELHVRRDGEGRLILEAWDNGAGFDTSGGFNTTGLDNMKKRAESLGGHLKIDSSINSGTTVAFRSAVFEFEQAERVSSKALVPQ